MKQVGLVVVDAGEGVQDRLQAMAAQIGHQILESAVVVAGQKLGDVRLAAEVARQLPTPSPAALKGERRIEGVRTLVDPALQRLAAWTRERLAHALAVLEGDHPPARRTERAVDPAEEAVGDHSVQALPVVVDDPPALSDIVLPPFHEGLVHVALVELGVSDDGDHASRRGRMADVTLQVGLNERGEHGHARPETHRSGGDVHLVRVLGPRRIALRPSETAEVLDGVQALFAEEVLDGMEDGAGMGLHRDPVLGPELVEVKGGHQRDHRRARGLVAADLEAVRPLAQVVGVVDHPGGEPQHLPFQFAQIGQDTGRRRSLGRRIQWSHRGSSRSCGRVAQFHYSGSGARASPRSGWLGRWASAIMGAARK